MATIKPINKYKVATISKFLGVNESDDAHLKIGEASTMQNCKISNNYGLRKRPGTSNVAGLVDGYTQSVSLDEVTLFTEYNETILEYSMYPEMSVSDTGIVSVSGTPVDVNYTNHAGYTGYYYTDGVKVYEFDDIVYSEAAEGGTAVTGGSVTISASLTTITGVSSFLAYPSIEVSNGAVVLTGTPVGVNYSNYASYIGRYFSYSGNIYRLYSARVEGDEVWGTDLRGDPILLGFTITYYEFKGYAVTYYDSDTYQWNFFEISATAAPTDEVVRTMWSGYVGSTEYIVAACDGCLWSLTESEGAWSKAIIGTLNTNTSVCLFGFDEKLYVMDGVDYKVWDASTYKTYTYIADGDETGDYYFTIGETEYTFTMPAVSEGDLLIYDESTEELTLDGETVVYTEEAATTETELTMTEAELFYPIADVTGYRPVVLTATTPAGVGTELQQTNKLNGLRSVYFSPDGVADAFQLPETGIASVDYVKDRVTGDNYTLTTDYTVSLANGTVTFEETPTAGTNTIEVGYTVSTTYRATVEAMRYATLYSGANENRVFVYGDGTSTTFYSGLDEDGKTRADYFPDLYVIDAGNSSTPITSMIKHYDRLLIFKTDSAYSVSYDTITLPSGVSTPGFYIRSVNADVGCVGYNQAVLVENHPRTLDSKAIYEWQATTTSGNVTGDQRNAQRVSDRVQRTLRTMDLESAVCFYDKYTHEYYVVEDGTAVVHNMETDAWYVYTEFTAACMARYKDELYMGFADGYVKHVSNDYMHDQGEDIQCVWRSGSMDFDSSWRMKYSDWVTVVLDPEDNSAVNVTVMTDRQDDYEDLSVVESLSGLVSEGFWDWLTLNFETLTFNTNEQLKTQKKKLKVKKFAWYRLIFTSVSNDTTFHVLETSIKVRETGVVK